MYLVFAIDVRDGRPHPPNAFPDGPPFDPREHPSEFTVSKIHVFPDLLEAADFVNERMETGLPGPPLTTRYAVIEAAELGQAMTVTLHNPEAL
jgi:hypothetical protein